MWLDGDEPVKPEIAVINFRPARCRFAGLVGQRIEEVQRMGDGNAS